MRNGCYPRTEIDAQGRRSLTLKAENWTFSLRAQPWLTEGQALNRMPCQSKSLKLCPSELAGHRLSRMPQGKLFIEVHLTGICPLWKCPRWCCWPPGWQEPDAGVSAHTAGDWWGNAPEPGRKIPSSCAFDWQNLTLYRLAKEKYLKGSSPLFAERQWGINVKRRQ